MIRHIPSRHLNGRRLSLRPLGLASGKFLRGDLFGMPYPFFAHRRQATKERRSCDREAPHRRYEVPLSLKDRIAGCPKFF